MPAPYWTPKGDRIVRSDAQIARGEGNDEKVRAWHAKHRICPASGVIVAEAYTPTAPIRCAACGQTVTVTALGTVATHHPAPTYQGAPKTVTVLCPAMVQHQHMCAVRGVDCHEHPTVRDIARSHPDIYFTGCYWRCDACGWGGWFDAPSRLASYPDAWFAKDCTWTVDGRVQGYGTPVRQEAQG